MNEVKKEYVTKRMVARCSKKIFKQAALKAMRDHGYVVVAKDGWVVKEYIDGMIEQICRIDSTGIGQEIILD